MAKDKTGSKPDFKRTKQYRELKSSMEDNLAARGLVEPIYLDMVNRYMSFRGMEYLADLDIQEKGLNVLDERRGTMMANPSVATKLNASRQAAQIYRALGFEDEAKKNHASGGDEDDEL